MRVVDDLFRMSQRERRARRRMACVGTCRGISKRDGRRQRLVADRTGPTAIANSQQFSIPAGCRQPHFDLDVRIRGRRAGQSHTTEGRRRGHGTGHGRSHAAARDGNRWRKRPCGDGTGRSDRRILKAQRRQALAGCGRCRAEASRRRAAAGRPCTGASKARATQIPAYRARMRCLLQPA